MNEQSPDLDASEWSIVEAFVGGPVRDRHSGRTAFWENTYATEQGLDDTSVRLAWLGDRVLNLVIADRIEASTAPTRPWSATGAQLRLQSRAKAAAVVDIWPTEVRALLRLGNTWRKRTVAPKLWAAYAEAIVGLVFREHGYPGAQAFVLQHWRG